MWRGVFLCVFLTTTFGVKESRVRGGVTTWLLYIQLRLLDREREEAGANEAMYVIS